MRGRLRRDTVLQLQPSLAGTLKIPPAQTGDAPRNRRIPFRFVQPDYFRRRMASQDENENRFHPEGNSNGVTRKPGKPGDLQAGEFGVEVFERALELGAIDFIAGRLDGREDPRAGEQ